jgi:hypothetical protein
VASVRLLAAGSALIAALAGCGGGQPGEAAAQAACAAYADTMRHQVATTVAGADAIRAEARTQATRAARADDEWRPLQRDIDDFFARQGALSQQSTADDANAYFAADERVRADCSAAGADIGPLRP